MPAMTAFDGQDEELRVPRGPDGLWRALVLSDPELEQLPTVDIPVEVSAPSMFDYEPSEAVPVFDDDLPPTEASEDTT